MRPPDISPPIAVLDTNVVLDWLVFRDPACALLAAAVVDGTIRWLATAPMREELAHVLARGHLDGWQPDHDALWSAWRRHCIDAPVPADTGPRGRLRCSDPDDQKFIDLALDCGARWLLSRDRAVLKLARRLRGHGVEVVAPGRWSLLPPG